MEEEKLRLYMVEYRFPDDSGHLATWDVNIPAKSSEEAQARLAVLSQTGEVVGVRSMAWLRREAKDFLEEDSISIAQDTQ